MQHMIKLNVEWAVWCMNQKEKKKKKSIGQEKKWIGKSNMSVMTTYQMIKVK